MMQYQWWAKSNRDSIITCRVLSAYHCHLC